MSDRSLIARIIEDYTATNPAGQSEEAIPWLLHALVLAVRPNVIVEIGAFMGLSSMAMAAGLKHNEEEPVNATLVAFNRTAHPAPGIPSGPGILYCIDPVRQPHFDRASQKFGLADRIRFIEKPSGEVNVESLPMIDLLFIDGLHSYRGVVDDFQRFAPRVSPGGLILIHDIFPDATRHTDTSQPWWGPNLFARQLRESADLGDFLWLDTHFPSMAILRKRVGHIDYPFLTTRGVVPAAIQYMWRSTFTAPKEIPVAAARWLSGGTRTRRWKILRSIARRVGLGSQHAGG